MKTHTENAMSLAADFSANELVAPASEGSNQSSSHPDGELVNPELDTVVPTPERRLALPISIKEEKSANTSAAGTVLSYEPAVFTWIPETPNSELI